MVSTVTRRVLMIRRVPAELRVPATYLPVPVMGRRTLSRVRHWIAVPTEVAEGVAHRVVQVEAGPAVHLYEPERLGASVDAALLWLHGGGMVMGTPEGDHAHCSRLALALGVPVVNVDYRLAPEHPAPAAIEDAWLALRWVLDAWPGLEASRVVVAGASAGGGLAAALAQVAHDRGVDIGLQLLVYPMLDDRTVRRRAGRQPWLGWTATSNRYAWRVYLGSRPGGRHVPTEMVPARREDLAGLAPTWIGVGDQDQFHDESVAYAAALTQAGVRCELHVQPGMFHGADGIFEDRTDTTREFRERLLGAARAGLRRPV